MTDWGHPSPNQNKRIYLYLRSIPSYPKFYLNPNCCSSFVLAAIEGVLYGMLTLGQPKARLPWRPPPGQVFFGFRSEIHKNRLDP
jgi:hypothetical protein